MNGQLKGLILEYKLYRHTNLVFARNTGIFGDTVLDFATEINIFLVSKIIYKDINIL